MRLQKENPRFIKTAKLEETLKVTEGQLGMQLSGSA
jgi:hypothetical protein